MKGQRQYIRYRKNIPTPEMRKGLYVLSPRTGWAVYTSQAAQDRGGYVDRNIGPRFDPRANQYEV